MFLTGRGVRIKASLLQGERFGERSGYSASTEKRYIVPLQKFDAFPKTTKEDYLAPIAITALRIKLMRCSKSSCLTISTNSLVSEGSS